MSLLGLPNELLFQIAKHFDANSTRSAGTMYSLLRTNHRMRSLMVPLIVQFALNEDIYCVTAFQLAVINKDEKMVRLLLEKSGVDMTSNDQRHPDLLDRRTLANSDMDDRVRKILEQGAKLSVRTRALEFTPLQFAAQKGHAMVLRMLLEKGVEIDYKGFSGKTALYYSAERGHESCVKILLENGADIEIGHGATKTTALHVAASQGHDKVVRLLIESGTNVNLRDKMWETPFHMAVSKHRISTVKFLLENGANIDAQSYDGETAVMLVVGPNRSPDSLELLRLLLENNATLDIQDDSGSTVLHRAVEFENECEEIVRLLLEKGANPTIWNCECNLAFDVAMGQEFRYGGDNYRGALKLLVEAELKEGDF